MRILREFRDTWRESGWRGAFRRYGWKLFAVIFVYYLIRDLTIYVLIPYLIAQRLLVTP